MSRAKRIKRGRQAPLQQAFINYFLHGTNPAIDKSIEGSIECFSIMLNHEKMKALWDENKESLMNEWIAKFPGSRPAAWWLFDSPRQPIGRYAGAYFDGTLPEQRKRLGGRGTAPWDMGKAVVPHYFKGIPDTSLWFDLDNEKPPIFESEASYLQRHNLLTKEEKEILSESDGHFKPQTLYEVMEGKSL